MRDYVVLRDLQVPRTNEPFGGGLRGSSFTFEEGPPPEPRVEVERLDTKGVLEVARDNEVVALCPNMPTKLIKPMGAAAEAAPGDAWGVATVGADASAFTGANVVVAVLDTGIDRSHPAFTGVTLVEKDFTGSGDGDVVGHGSHCAGTIFGRDVDGARIGVARGVTKALIGKVLPDAGGGTSDMIVRAINWAVDEGADVVSMSLGWDFPGLVEQLTGEGWPADLATSRALEDYRANLGLFDALMDLVRKRSLFGSAVVVAAAGNDSKRSVHSDYEIATTLPAAAEGVISVGALASDGTLLRVAPFSNTFPQLSAPGVAIKSAQRGGGTCEMDGTSMACPHVAGVAALWWEAVRSGPVPPTALIVQSKLLALARNDLFAEGVQIPDRGAGLATSP